ncbi:MAG TPA: hypothetical protein PLV25_00670, partial [Opitutales bacterium]|nr:hypothetical protein [Opitutales bacterium]
DHLTPEIYQEAALGLLESWIAQGSWQQAHNWQQAHIHQVDFSTPQGKLIQALLSWNAGQVEAAQSTLSTVQSTGLPDSLHFEYFMLQGYLDIQQKKLVQSREPFLAALQSSRTPLQSALAQTQIDLIDVRTHAVTDASLDEIQNKLKKTRNRQAHAQLTWLYAQMLVSVGRTDAAQVALATELKKIKSVDGSLLDNLLYLQAIISEPGSPYATESWKALLERGTAEASRRLQALYALQSQLQLNPDWPVFLEKCLQRNRTEPLVDALTFAQAQWAFAQHNGPLAVDYVRKLLQRSPKSVFGLQSYGLEALVALSQSPAQYRIAAAALANGQRDFGAKGVGPQWGLLEADCLYLAKDYPQAALLYKGFIDVPAPGVDINEVVLKWVWAQLEAKDSEPVTAFLASASLSHSYPQSTLVRIAWYLAKNEYERGQVQQALIALEPWCTPVVLDEVCSTWKAKMFWLGAVLDFQLGHTQFAFTKAQAALQEARQAQGQAHLSADSACLVAECLLLSAQIEFRLDRPDAAQTLLVELRAAHGATEPAEVSYLLEARYYARTHQWAQAQQSDLKLVELYPKSPYAPVALYEGAICAERQGGVHSSEEAMRILDRLIKEYPSSEWVFEARFEQGQVLRQLGRFGSAQVVYDGIIHDYPQSEDLWRARLARADCLLALASNDPAKGGLAAAAYERVFDLTTIPNAARAEAGFKWGAALEEQNKILAAKEAYWGMLNTLLIQPQLVNPKAPIEGGFWMSRAILALGQLLERESQPEDAYKVYGWIEHYGLPGQDWAKSKMERIEKS